MAGGANHQQKELQNFREKMYFETHHLNLETSTQLDIVQSNIAMHYLSISPPRIRITNEQGAVSPVLGAFKSELYRWAQKFTYPITKALQ